MTCVLYKGQKIMAMVNVVKHVFERYKLLAWTTLTCTWFTGRLLRG